MAWQACQLGAVLLLYILTVLGYNQDNINVRVLFILPEAVKGQWHLVVQCVKSTPCLNVATTC